MIAKWKTPFLTFFTFSFILYVTTSYLNQKVEEPFEKFRIPGKDRFFVFIISAHNVENTFEPTLSSILEQSYQNYHIYYIDDGSTDNTYDAVKLYINKYYPHAPVTLIKNTYRKGSAQNAYEQITKCKNHNVITLLDDNCKLANEHVLKEFNDLYRVDKVWLVYGQHYCTTTKKVGGCRKAPSLSFFSSMRKRHWERPCMKTFYAGLYRQVKLEDFFFKGKFIDDEFDAAYMFPMIEMAGEHTGFIDQVICKRSEKPSSSSSAEHKNKYKEWISKASPYKQLKKHPGIGTVKEKKKREADLLIFSYDRPMQLYALLESIDRYVVGLNSISVIYRASTNDFFNAYETLRNELKSIRFIKQSISPELDFKPLVLHAIFEKGSSSSPYIIFSSDDIVVKDYIDVSNCIDTLKQSGAYCFALRLGKRVKYHYPEDTTIEIPNLVKISDEAYAWQINAKKGDWTHVNCVDMNLYRKVDLHRPLYTIDYKDPFELEKNWAENTKPFLREKRQRVGICYSDSKVVNIPLNGTFARNMNLYTNKELLKLFEKGLKIDINTVFQTSNISYHLEHRPDFVSREKDLLPKLSDKLKI